MNIFYLSDDPRQAAQWMVDKHVVKMITESAQLLSTAHRVLDGRMEVIVPEYDPYKPDAPRRARKFWELADSRYILYKATHVNHPSNVWIRQSVENYCWLVDHLYSLIDEYDYRYGKKDKFMVVRQMMHLLQPPPFNLKEYDRTPIICAMDDEYIISDDPVMNYQNYYRVAKTRMHKWTKREIPEWINAA